MHEHIRANRRRTLILLLAMAFLLATMGYVLAEYVARGAGAFGVFVALIVWSVQALISYFSGGRIVLGLSGARRIEKKDHPILFNTVEEMCVASGLSRIPEIYIIDDDALNAFATGRDPEHAALAVTAGLLKELDRDELQGVIGHEISHINNRDVLYMTMVAIMMGTIIVLADLGRRSMFRGSGTRTGRRRGGGGAILIVALALMILSPLLARLLYLAVSRRREYLADASAALYTRYPEGLARALEKLGGSNKKLVSASPATAPMYIVNPLAELSSTHPATAERVRILRSMGAGGTPSSYSEAFRNVTGRAVGVLPFVGTNAIPAGSPAAPALDHVERVRLTTDALWSLNDYTLMDCPCGTKLKIPPAWRGKKIECPHCGRLHESGA